MNELLYISWNVSPNLYEGFITLRYYSLLFGVSFFLGYYLMKKMMANEKCPEKWLDKILIYTVVATVIGARLGHVFFYDWDYYSQHLVEILMVWKGGLASHGAAIAIVIALWWYSKKITKKSILWSLDKVVVTVAIAACFIRVGNLMNSEIIGHRSESSNAFFFQNEAERSIAGFFRVTKNDIDVEPLDEDTVINGFKYPLAKVSIAFPQAINLSDKAFQSFYSYNKENYRESESHYFSLPPPENYYFNKNNSVLTITIGLIPRVPAQLIEAGSYFLIFILLFWGYWKKKWYEKQGLIFGLFLTFLFGSRFFIEFWKEHQTLSDDSLLNMGQWLSIPIVAAGLVLIIVALNKKKTVHNES